MSSHSRMTRALQGLGKTSPALVSIALANLILLVIFLIDLALDPTRVAGQPAWLKPVKFAISIPAYSLTLAWMLAHVEGRRRLVRRIGQVTAAGLAVEILLIGFQAARGVPSHFNTSTYLDAAVFSVMGIVILVVWIAGLVAAGLLLRQRFEDLAFGWALRSGLVLSLLGAGMGGLMTRPTDSQVEQIQREGHPPPQMGAHTVGALDEGPGLPVVGFSTVGGDLRVPHFLGLHAMQLLPLFGLRLSRRAPSRRWGARHRLGLVWISGVAYLGLIGILTLQALRGEPLFAPSSVTVRALGVLAGVSLLSVVAIVADARRRTARLTRSEIAPC